MPRLFSFGSLLAGVRRPEGLCRDGSGRLSRLLTTVRQLALQRWYFGVLLKAGGVQCVNGLVLLGHDFVQLSNDSFLESRVMQEYSASGGVAT